MSRSFLLALLTSSALIGFTIGGYAQQNTTPPAEPAKTEQVTKTDKPKKSQQEMDDETYRQLNLFGEVFERVRAQYVDPVEDKTLIENAINGMLSSLDPHSAYLNDDGLKDMQVQTRGEFGGLGIEVTQENGLIKVVTPIDDTPAAKAGIQSGDFITHLDGKPMIGLNLNEAVDMLRGKVGSKIVLTIRRDSVAEPLKIPLVRDTIKIQSVRSRVEGNVGYIRITSFSDNTTDGLKKAIEDIQKQLGNKLTGYVLDLRNNPGGLLEQAIGVSDVFLDKGEIVSTRGRNERDTRRDNATPGDLANDLPIVVIINGGTASAAEIVSGALQDHHRAILLGTQSFGKGSVQTVMPMPGHGAMKLTTARYYTPSGRSIQAKGITPDILVEPAKIEATEDGDRIKEADLKGALANPDGSVTPLPKITIQVEDPTTKTKDGKDAKDADAPKKSQAEQQADAAKKDYQLQRALDLVRGISLYTEDHTAKTSATVLAPTDDKKADKTSDAKPTPAPEEKTQPKE